MTDRDRERIRAAALKAAQQSRQAQGLPERIADPAVIANVAAIIRAQGEDRRAA